MCAVASAARRTDALGGEKAGRWRVPETEHGCGPVRLERVKAAASDTCRSMRPQSEAVRSCPVCGVRGCGSIGGTPD